MCYLPRWIPVLQYLSSSSSSGMGFFPYGLLSLCSFVPLRSLQFPENGAVSILPVNVDLEP